MVHRLYIEGDFCIVVKKMNGFQIRWETGRSNKNGLESKPVEQDGRFWMFDIKVCGQYEVIVNDTAITAAVLKRCPQGDKCPHLKFGAES